MVLAHVIAVIITLLFIIGTTSILMAIFEISKIEHHILNPPGKATKINRTEPVVEDILDDFEMDEDILEA